LHHHRQSKVEAGIEAGCNTRDTKPDRNKLGASMSQSVWRWWGKPLWHDVGYVAVSVVGTDIIPS
jgi:hypothetical protein